MLKTFPRRPVAPDPRSLSFSGYFSKAVDLTQKPPDNSSLVALIPHLASFVITERITTRMENPALARKAS
jgi:hypothetical protein